MAKFFIGERVKIVKLLDDITNRKLIGVVGVIEGIDELPNGQVNYYVGSHYMHEQELEAVKNDERKYIYECRKCGFRGEREEFRKPYFPGGLAGISPPPFLCLWPPFPNFRCPKCKNQAVDSLVFVKAVQEEGDAYRD